MKTRIKVTELNDGTKMYTCQSLYEDSPSLKAKIIIYSLVSLVLVSGLFVTNFTNLAVWVISFLILFLLYIASKDDWFVMTVYKEDNKKYFTTVNYFDREATFINIETAKQFIDDSIEERNKEKIEEKNKEIKLVNYIKYP